MRATEEALLVSRSLWDIVAQGAAESPDTVALRFLGDGEGETARLTRGALAARAEALAAQVAALARPGDRALLAYPAGLDFTVAFLACLRAGVIAVPVDVRRRRGAADRIAGIARDCAPALLLTHSDARDRLPDLGLPWQCSDALEQAAAPPAPPPPAGGDAIAYLQYSSGSTGSPRGAMVSHRALLHQLDAYRDRGGAGWRSFVLVSWLPHSHDFGLVGFHLSALHMGRPLVFMPPGAFLRRPLRWIEAISTWRGSYCGGPPFGYALCATAAGEARGLDLSAWEIASLGGDYVRPETLARFEAAFAPFGFRPAAWLPAYGMAETVLCATGRHGAHILHVDAAALRQGHAARGEGVRLVSCGTPTPGMTVRIADPDHAAPLGEGRIGEVWLSGAGLASGYWGDPQGSTATFGARLAGEPAPHLRTGDMGFVLDGELYVTGRRKDVLVVHGANHAPEPIEETIQSVDPRLRWGAGAVVQRAGHAGAGLVALQEVARDAGTFDPAAFAQIAAAVAERHGLALEAIQLTRPGALPRTPSGKISRHRCLAEWEAGRLPAVAQWQRGEAPPNPLEARLLALARELLPGRAVRADDNLFALGLDSLAAQTLLGGVEARLGRSVPIAWLFETPSIAALAARLGDAPAAPDALQALRAELHRLTARVDAQEQRIAEFSARLKAEVALPIPAAPPAALNPMQRELLRLRRLHADPPALSRCAVLEATAPIDRERLRAALSRLAARHDALRMLVTGDAPRLLDRAAPVPDQVRLDDAGGLVAWLSAERAKPFDLAQRPGWGAVLVTAPGAQWIVLRADPVVLDSAALAVLAGELATLLADPAADLPPVDQPGDLAARRSEQRGGEAMVAARAHWRARLGDALGDFTLPGAPRRRRPLPLAAGVERVMLPPALRTALVHRGAQASATLFQLVLAAWMVVLHRRSGQRRLTVGIEASDRCVDAQGVVGSCSTLLPVVAEFAGSLAIHALLQSVRTQVADGVAHRCYTLADWARDAGLPPDPDRPLALGAAIRFDRAPRQLPGLRWCAETDAASLRDSPYALLLRVCEDEEGGIALELVHNHALVDSEWAARCLGGLVRLLHGVAEDGEADSLALPLLDAGEGVAVAEAESAEADFLPRFAAQVAASPNAEAVRGPHDACSYAQLDARADAIAAALAGQEGPVALLAAPGAEAVAALIGSLRAARVCIPLDPTRAEPILAERLERADAALLLHDAAHSGLAGRLAACSARRLAACPLDSIAASARTRPPVPPDAPALCLMDGAQTVTLTHRALGDRLATKAALLRLSPGARIAWTAPAGTPAALWQSLAPLIAGGCVTLLGEETRGDLRARFRAAEDAAVAVLALAPSELRHAFEFLFDPAGAPGFRALRHLVLAGEPLAADLCRRWIGLYPHVPILHAHTLAVFGGDVAHQPVDWPPAMERVRVPIGIPAQGVRLAVVDRTGQPVPQGAFGELAFGEGGAPLRRSGERARLRDDGSFEVLGPIDDLLVIDGVETDPLEIAAAIQRDPAVFESHVTQWPDAQGRLRLVAHVVFRRGMASPEGALKAAARHSLPPALVPAAFVALDALPRLACGAIDTAQLPAPDFAVAADATPPANRAEAAVLEVWQQALGLDAPCGVHADFFELGGCSLDAARITAQLDARFGTRSSQDLLFRAPTVAGLAALLGPLPHHAAAP